MNKLRSASLLCFVLVSSAALNPAKSDPQAPAASQAPVVLRSTTRLVQINVIVHNKKGEPVEGLSQEDFAIFDQGQAQQVATFSEVGSVPGESFKNSALPPNVFSNRLGQTGRTPGSITVILFDALNTSIQDQVYAKQQVVKFLRQLHPQDHVAIYVLTTRIIVLNDFTQDSSTLLRAIEQFGGYSSASHAASNPSSTSQNIFAVHTPETDAMTSKLNEFLDGASGRISAFANINRAETTTSAIEVIAKHVARVPGRKNLIWVSGSFPMTIGFEGEEMFHPNREQRSFTSEIERAARALNQANMAIYPVDARGLMVSPHYDVTNGSGFTFIAPVVDLGPDQRNFDTMIVLADRTGGKASYNTNDIEGAVQRALADGQFTYTLGFYPTHNTWDGKFHNLKVQVNKKGLTLRHRKGYFASPEPPSGPTESQAALEAAVWSPVEWTNLDLQVTSKAFEASSRTVALQVALDTRELLLDAKDGQWRGMVDLLFVQLGAGDKVIAREQQEFGLNLKQESYERLLKIGTKITGRLVLSPDVVNLRVVARDASSGAIGTLTIPVMRLLSAENTSNGAASQP
jgi:VWFA-related protein